MDRQELRIEDSVGKNTPAYGAGRRGMSKGSRGNKDQRDKRKTGKVLGFERQCQSVSRRWCYCSFHLKRIKIKKIPLDLARGITCDLSVE